MSEWHDAEIGAAHIVNILLALSAVPLICMGMTASLPEKAVENPFPGFSNPVLWQEHLDGGHAPAKGMDEAHAQEGCPAMRITYQDQDPHWGNLVLAANVPDDAVGLQFRVFKHSASPGAALHVWLFEQDGDGWVQQVGFEEGTFADILNGWHEVWMPLSGFRYDPRGDKKRDMRSVQKILLGCNYADLDATVSGARWLITDQRMSASGPITEGLDIQPGARGVVGIWKDAVDCPGIPSNPEVLAQALKEAGWGIAFLKGGDLARSEVMTPARLDLVILPYGSAFPEEAREVFVRYLKAGGSFLSAGGYAFDALVRWTGESWVPSDATITPDRMGEEGKEYSMNTRKGKPGDTMGVLPDQIGAFDPGYLLEGAVNLCIPKEQHILSQEQDGVSVLSNPQSAVRNITGYAATCLNSENSPVFPRRWARVVPVVEARDAYGRSRGPVGSCLFHYDGPFKGSSWAFFGLTDRDLFSKDASGSLLSRLPALAEALTRKVFIETFEPSLACYDPQAQDIPEVKALVVNLGKEPREIEVSFEGQEGAMVPSKTPRVLLKPGETVDLTSRSEAVSEHLFSEIRATLSVGDTPVDVLSTGWVSFSPQDTAEGLKFGFKDNYFAFDGRSRFLCGTNQTGMMFFSADEDPLVWDRDFQDMSDRGVKILRILHFSPFVSEDPGRKSAVALDLKEAPPLKMQRQTDAMVGLARKHGLVIFLTLHDWMPVELTDEELEAQKIWASFWSNRYRTQSHVIFDVQNEPAVELKDWPQVVELWQDWLLKRYGSREAVWTAWGQSGELPPSFALDSPDSGGEWTSVQECDRQWFRAFLVNRWVQANAQGIQAGNPKVPFAVGYLPSMGPADKILGTAYTRFSNMHFYGNRLDLAWELKLIDQRLQGKSLSLGEFGSQEMHEARVKGEDVADERASIVRFLHTTHSAYSLGGSFVCNWDWKDMYGGIFPWGLNHPDRVPKRIMTAYRNMSIFLGAPEPVWESPKIGFLMPDSFRLGPKYNSIHDHLKGALSALSRCHVDVAVINEEALAKGEEIPEILIWPLAYSPSDAVFDQVMGMVRQGVQLFMSGDPSYDEKRQRTREDRFKILRIDPPQAHDPLASSSSVADPVRRKMGQGSVTFVAGPLEMKSRQEIQSAYAHFLDEVKADRMPMAGQAEFAAGSIPTRDRGRVFIGLGEEDPEGSVRILWGGGDVPIKTGGSLPSLAWLSDRGVCLALEDPGLSLEKGYAGFLSLDGQDVRESECLFVLPFLPGRMQLPGKGRKAMVMQPMDFQDGKPVALGEPVLVPEEGPLDLPPLLDAFVICPKHKVAPSMAQAFQFLP